MNPRTDLALENLALRQQLALVSHKATKRPRPRRLDRMFWVVLSKVWPRWKTALVIVKPNTVVALVMPTATFSLPYVLVNHSG